MVGGSAGQISLKTQCLLMLMRSPFLCSGAKTADSPNPVSRLKILSLEGIGKLKIKLRKGKLPSPTGNVRACVVAFCVEAEEEGAPSKSR